MAAAVASSAALLVTGSTLSGPAQGTTDGSDAARAVRHNVPVKGLDNPRQLSLTHGGKLVVALAGHGGNTGRLVVVDGRHVRKVIRGYPSFADNGMFAVGLDGGSKRAGGAFFATAVPHKAPPGQRRDEWLIAKRPGGHVHKVANIGRFERRHNPDGEVIESNPYSVLALKHQVLVADAAGDYIAQVKGDKVRVWAVMPEYGKQVDAVPTVVTRGADGYVYVGELHSEKRHKAKVWKFSRDGKRLRSWKGFTTVTGVARTANGTLYVSELFGGPCGFEDIPSCFPGRVVKVSPNGDRSYFRVPFPAGIAARGHHVWVSAFSVCPGAGCEGSPATSGRIWHFRA